MQLLRCDSVESCEYILKNTQCNSLNRCFQLLVKLEEKKIQLEKKLKKNEKFLNKFGWCQYFGKCGLLLNENIKLNRVLSYITGIQSETKKKIKNVNNHKNKILF